MSQAVNIQKLEYALKHLSRAAKHIKQREISRKDLHRSIQRIKASAKKGRYIAKDIEELEF